MGELRHSRNFGFLNEYDPLLVEYGLRAELNAYSDPNTSLIKTRQFGELLARSTAYHASMDCSNHKFDEILGLLKRQGLIPGEVLADFNQVRLYGNDAAHEHKCDCTAALQSLILAHRLAKWFMQCVLKKVDFCAGAFKPLPTPEDATRELMEEIEFLRKQAAISELATTATEAQKQELVKKLEREAAEYQVELTRQATVLQEREIDLRLLELKSQTRLKQVISVANSGVFQSFIERSELSASRTGKRDLDSLPLMQLRIMTGQKCYLCQEPMIVVQSMSGGFITQNCTKCNTSKSVSKAGFYELAESVYVSCPDCRKRMGSSMVRKNYGFCCDGCGRSYELAALAPHYSDI